MISLLRILISQIIIASPGKKVCYCVFVNKVLLRIVKLQCCCGKDGSMKWT